MGCGKSVPVQEALETPPVQPAVIPRDSPDCVQHGEFNKTNAPSFKEEKKSSVHRVNGEQSTAISTPERANLRVWICLKDTGKRTVFTIHESQVCNTSCEDFCRLLMSPAHKGRLLQLGFTGDTLFVLGADDNTRQPSSVLTLEEIQGCQGQDHPLLTSTKQIRQEIKTIRSGHGTELEMTMDVSAKETSPRKPNTEATNTGTPRSARVDPALNDSVESNASTVIGLSPAAIAQKAEIEHIKSKYVPDKLDSFRQIYTASQHIPEIQRDIHSHLKKKEVPPQKDARSAEEAEIRQRAQQDPSKVSKARKGASTLSKEQLILLQGQLNGFAEKHRGTDRATLLESLRKVLTPDSWKALVDKANKADSAWAGEACIEWLCGYVDFAQHHNLAPKDSKLPLELREESDPYYPAHMWATPPSRKAYALVPVAWSLLGSVAGASLTYLLDDSPGSGTLSRWATGRFLDAELGTAWSGPAQTRPLFGFCGQLPGVSKQALLCGQGELQGRGREAMLSCCQPDDPNEYPRAAAGRDAFVVQIEHGKSAAVDELLGPMVVLDAAVLVGASNVGWDEGDEWTTLEGFGPGGVPGYTATGRGVVLIKSGQVEARTVEELRSQGVVCSRLAA